MEKRRLMCNKEVNYYCRGVDKNVFLYICNLNKAEELHMKYCDCCHNLNYCVYLRKSNYTLHNYIRCDICESKEGHYHKLCGKCYETRYLKTVGFIKETIFVK